MGTAEIKQHMLFQNAKKNSARYLNAIKKQASPPRGCLSIVK
jgi:hypothetical protein